MVEISEDYVQSEVVHDELENIIRNGDPNVLTVFKIRRELERKLNLEEKALDEYKKIINSKIDAIFAKIMEQEENNEPTDKTSQSPQSEHEQIPAEPTDRPEVEEEEEQNQKSPANTPPAEPADHPEDEEEGEQNQKPAAKTPPAKRKRKSEKASATAKAKDKNESKSALCKTTSPSSSSAAEETVKRLKSYVFKCGVRKMWIKELADCETVNSQIERLKSILRDIGVEGRPTLEKCQKIKAERELKAEIESLSKENILDEETRGRRGTRSQKRRRIIESEDEGEEPGQEETPSNKLNVSFLGDQSDS
ncbi:hypothetical protein BX666DRAFT_1894735, partial [Dichotomocladium elegans]